MDKLISLTDVSQEELRRWQLKLLDILVYFKEFCEKHDLTFYLSYGTMLGAVRHNGFIPWDDDIDVSMPREDYDKLYDLWEKHADKARFSCCKTTKGNCIYFPMTLIRDNTTTCIYEHSKHLDLCHGLKIDVEFLDGVPNSSFLRMKQVFFARMYALFSTQRVPNAVYKSGRSAIRIIAKTLLTIFRSAKVRDFIWMYSEKQIKKYDFSSSLYIRHLGLRLQKKEWYKDVIYMDFEGHKMPVPVGYDEILRSAYGDYMQLPPIEGRIPITKVVFYDLENGYKKYKGIHYCVESNKDNDL